MGSSLARRIALCALLAAAPSGRALAAYEDVGVSARVTGLGQAYTAVADDVYSVYYNPAGLATLERPELSTTYSRLLTGLSDGTNVQNSHITYARPLDGGRNGTVGAAWNRFNVGGLYTENQLMTSYGRALFARDNPGRYYLGGTFKLLSRSIGGTSAATNGISNTGAVTGPDPALQTTSKNNFDVDLGFLWRVKPRWTVGLMLQHVLEPNIGFSSEDKLGRNVKFGAAYKTPFTVMSSDVRLQSAPDGSTDKIIALGAEKWLPTLLHGAFGVRGALSTGSRDHRQMAFGLSYKINRLQFDYGFSLPLGGLAGTSGSHRIGLTMRFGRSREAEAALSEALLENLSDVAVGNTELFRQQLNNVAQYRRTAIEEFLRQARVDATEGRFADAAEKLRQASGFNPDSAPLADSRDRMSDIAGVMPVLKDYVSVPYAAVLYEAALHYAGTRDREALRKAAYARALDDADPRAIALEAAIVKRTGLSPEAVVPPAASGTPVPAPDVAVSTEAAAADSGMTGSQKLVWALMSQMEEGLHAKDHARVIALGTEVLRVDPENALAYRRIGAAYYAMRKHAEALKTLRTARKLETDPQQRASLDSYIKALETIVNRAAAKPVEAKAPAAATPGDIEKLYEAGVELYAQGKLSEAASLFRRILAAEPNNVSARRALDRVNSELLMSGKDK